MKNLSWVNLLEEDFYKKLKLDEEEIFILTEFDDF